MKHKKTDNDNLTTARFLDADAPGNALRRRVLKRMLFWMTIAGTLLLSLVFGIWHLIEQGTIESIIHEAEQSQAFREGAFEDEQASIVSDLRMLASFTGIRRFLSTGSAEMKTRLIEDFRVVSA